mmetsp:Transcript_10644/g.27857  ORF Transcript_10644/g.27857 Transcript_10644/m.27857 type:complete len:290 (-) Transcript_10644:300-1169(-)
MLKVPSHSIDFDKNSNTDSVESPLQFGMMPARKSLYLDGTSASTSTSTKRSSDNADATKKTSSYLLSDRVGPSSSGKKNSGLKSSGSPFSYSSLLARRMLKKETAVLVPPHDSSSPRELSCSPQQLEDSSSAVRKMAGFGLAEKRWTHDGESYSLPSIGLSSTAHTSNQYEQTRRSHTDESGVFSIYLSPDTDKPSSKVRRVSSSSPSLPSHPAPLFPTSASNIGEAGYVVRRGRTHASAKKDRFDTLRAQAVAKRLAAKGVQWSDKDIHESVKKGEGEMVAVRRRLAL